MLLLNDNGIDIETILLCVIPITQVVMAGIYSVKSNQTDVDIDKQRIPSLAVGNDLLREGESPFEMLSLGIHVVVSLFTAEALNGNVVFHRGITSSSQIPAFDLGEIRALTSMAIL